MSRFINVRTTLAVLAVLLVVSGLQAQTTTGRLIGKIVDEQNVALPGVTVTISSPLLMGGAQTRITDGAGEFSFIGLPPGDYNVNAVLSGFVTQERSEVKVPLGGAASIIIGLPEGSFEGEIEVVAETPVVDPTQVNTEQVFDSAYLQDAAIGSANRGYQSVLVQAPGVGGGSNPNVFGSTLGENAYYVDGMNTTDPVTATFGTNFNFDAIQEIQFQTGGFEAEYGNATGGIVNLITKSGGNQFSGTLDVRYQNDSMLTSGDHYDASTQDRSFYDVGVTLGGPILRDKLWFFVAYEWVDSRRTPTGSPTTRKFVGTYPIAKLTWQASPSLRVIGKYTADPADIDNVNASASRVDNSTYFQYQNTDIANIELSAVLSDSLLLNVIGGAYRGELDSTPQNGDLSLIAYDNLDTGVWRNSYSNQQYSKRDRDQLGADLTWFVDGLAGSHEFKGGVQYQDLYFESANCNTGVATGEVCNPDVGGGYIWELGGVPAGEPGLPYVWWTDWNNDFAGTNGTVGTAYIQDAWRVSPNVTFKIGVRYDNAKYDNDEAFQVSGLDKVQPRLGVAWDVTGDAKNVIRGSFGRFMHPNAMTLPSFARVQASTEGAWLSCSTIYGLEAADCQQFAIDNGREWGQDADNFDPNGWLLNPWNIFGSEPNDVDPNLKATYADEIILSYEREVGRRASVEFTYVDKKTRDIFEDTCDGNFPGPPSEDASCNYYTMANFDDLKRDYQGFIVKYETRTFDWLTLLSSYTYSTSEGSQSYNQNAGVDLDFYPAHFDNRYGYMPDHAKHRFKLNGFFSIKGDWTIGFDFFYSSPYTYTPQANSADSGGEWNGEEIPDIPYGTWFAEARGNREANSESQLDLQLSKGFTVGGMRFVLIGSVYNAISSEDVATVCTSISGCIDPEDSTSTVDLGGAQTWQQPRRYEVGFRFEF